MNFKLLADTPCFIGNRSQLTGPLAGDGSHGWLSSSSGRDKHLPDVCGPWDRLVLLAASCLDLITLLLELDELIFMHKSVDKYLAASNTAGWRWEWSTYGHSQLKTGHPVRSAIHKQLNGRLVLRWVTTWESL
ncbi:hypothetical protein KCU62_g7603, partial [Aureobasidium sp. EXF-3399]